jgi:hypothetical protein
MDEVLRINTAVISFVSRMLDVLLMNDSLCISAYFLLSNNIASTRNLRSK